ncbi:GntR family transcriptional regulator [Paenibacillus marchantiophytorum]|uniref:GntR family transcriptional regulator n=1 Tax=Paenibacillus marchantiophytorum TaxID=1619310 RepID=A0ABQ1EL39_9BACL|nr:MULTISPECIES: GntR family transcriptional regulator [Paenibacillus]UKS27497.1 GntR family transcriptional regulator [Paenibacillus sp. HWE-109]GFZ76770.1 GntR family transcriptional regulator [Paenibacillus marchantiophytorum]
MNLSFNNRDPVYLQVVRYFKEEIATGKLAAGKEIPSRRELAGMFQINPNTAQKAYKEMEEQKLITTEGNSPSRITTDAHILNSIREELIREAVEVFVQSIRKMELPTDELLRFVKEKYESERTGRDTE